MPKRKSIKTAKKKVTEAFQYYKEAWEALPIGQKKDEGLIAHIMLSVDEKTDKVESQLVTIARKDVALFMLKKIIKTMKE